MIKNNSQIYYLLIPIGTYLSEQVSSRENGQAAIRAIAANLTHCRRGFIGNNDDHRIIGALARIGRHMSRRRTLHYDIGSNLSH